MQPGNTQRAGSRATCSYFCASHGARPMCVRLRGLYCPVVPISCRPLHMLSGRGAPYGSFTLVTESREPLKEMAQGQKHEEGHRPALGDGWQRNHGEEEAIVPGRSAHQYQPTSFYLLKVSII